MVEVKFLSVKDVLFIHKNTIENEGGILGLRDRNLLESAVMMPQQTFEGKYLYGDLQKMALAYLVHIVKNHPFIDGNKRTGALCLLIFLRINNFNNLPKPDKLENLTMLIASGEDFVEKSKTLFD